MTRTLQYPVISSVLLAALVGACGPAVNEDGIARSTVQEIDRAFRDTARAELALSPETATRLGLAETSLRQPFQNQLDDRSQARFERTRLLRIELLDRLGETPDIPADSQLARDLQVIRAEYEALTHLQSYGYGRYAPGMARPYAADQLSGAWIDVPELLIESHPLNTHAEASAYLDRLAALPGALADERRRLESDAANGIVPPRFILEALETRLRAIASQPLETHPLIQNFGYAVGALDPEEGRPANTYRQAAVRLMLGQVLPAYSDFADAVSELAETAGPAPGLASLPDGDAYYREVLAYYTQPGAEPDFMHREGLTAVASINAEIDVQLAAIGLETGSVGERLALLAASSSEAFAPDEAGRAAILDELNRLVDAAEASLPGLVGEASIPALSVTRMPAYKEMAFAGASYAPATANGSRPGLFQINLSDTADWPAFTLPTLLYHEAVPGHHVESAMASKRAQQPLLRQMIWDTAYGEGWAVYAEDLADAGGLYEGDPLGRIGYLQSVLFRAARLVVDTGIHSKGWSLGQAVDYLTDTTGLPRAAMEEEVARYAVWPGQAAAYYAGRRRILDMRTRAEAVLGGRFDQAAFNAAVLEGGPRPLSMVEQDVEAWYGELLRR